MLASKPVYLGQPPTPGISLHMRLEPNHRRHCLLGPGAFPRPSIDCTRNCLSLIAGDGALNEPSGNCTVVHFNNFCSASQYHRASAPAVPVYRLRLASIVCVARRMARAKRKRRLTRVPFRSSPREPETNCADRRSLSWFRGSPGPRFTPDFSFNQPDFDSLDAEKTRRNSTRRQRPH